MVSLFGEKTTATNVAEFTVSEIAGALKRVVEEKFGYVRVRGEISGYRGAHASGHAYFSLKDDKARLEAVIWRGFMEKLKFPPEEGMEVVAVGKLTTYPGSSKYQIVIEALEPTGVGALMTLLENRKKKFAEEGLFDEAKKKPLPYMPRVIGVVTSPTGAVIRDIIHRISDRFPLHILVWPVRVQGETSGSEVAAAVEGFNALSSGGPVPKPDLLIVARGGGSLEDLWGFNDEAVVRAVYASELPVISAVGHETDWTLIDYVADWRAPTPTGAAEKAVPVKLDLEVSVASLGARLRKGLARSFDFHQQKLRAARRGLPSVDQLFALPRRGFDEISSRLQRALCVSYDKKRFSFHALHLRLSPRLLKSEKAHRYTKEYTARLHRAFMRSIEKQYAALELACRLLKSTSYQNILERGFVLALGQDHKPIKRLAQFPENGQINLRFFDGDICVATQEPASSTRSKHKKIKSPSDDQGTLF
ncbi:exodeoxyribonuclease VII large subunit [Bartonella krasnovii]|uniref:Exodeoxyribonuclease 7 large subunit n=1 Tax=Bartonella krasnovii TaxID=2267275 RepID=A0A5B9D2D4_9HYPH|nr:exodeoxyribonuclease VII large subunit [Bartonella krasnovii]QEE12612.1 exodeoxyribonuclease VII large subunit [Bartonella krasnovii]UNF38400.1 exodeoxyribonuclease VII large subunit [Bartonella krasnovii]UNF40038.1 exodeoxyribonuclease VII large subunit [Bartonella krasnovii]UNF43446.1 exodeoxyribonuclease VII large subunit [Bartonella krasnovii]UNF49938.1 exodeoxyribonuclease VII large subunit [Bartonella krasnovii]